MLFLKTYLANQSVQIIQHSTIILKGTFLRKVLHFSFWVLKLYVPNQVSLVISE